MPWRIPDLAPQRPTAVVGVDVGATRTKAALFDPAMRPLAERAADTPTGAGPQAVLDGAAALVEDLVVRAADRDAVVRGIAVVVPGIVDEARGVAEYAANLGWRDLPVAAWLGARLGRTVAVGHDVRAGALAEHRLGAARGAGDALFLAIGTGVAGGLILGGVPYARAYAGELGHLEVEPSGPRCACGRRGCLEAIASARAIAARYREEAGAGATAADVAQRAAEGDEIAVRVWARAARALAAAIVAYTTILAPDVVVLGGGLAAAGAQLADPVAAGVRERLPFQRVPAVRTGALGDRAGCAGAGLLAWRRAGAAVAKPS